MMSISAWTRSTVCWQDYSLLERFFREEQTEYRQQVEGFLPPVEK